MYTASKMAEKIWLTIQVVLVDNYIVYLNEFHRLSVAKCQVILFPNSWKHFCTTAEQDRREMSVLVYRSILHIMQTLVWFIVIVWNHYLFVDFFLFWFIWCFLVHNTKVPVHKKLVRD